MAANQDPIFCGTPDIQSGGGAVIGPTANTNQDGTGTVYSVWQADATNGGFCQKLMAKSVGSPVATAFRVYISSITGTFTGNTAANTWLIKDVSLPTTTLSQTAGSLDVEVPINLPIPPGYRVCCSFGTSTGAAGTGWMVTGVGGKY